jgi:hypothetical protein
MGTDSYVPQPSLSPDTIGFEIETDLLTRPDTVQVHRQRVEIADDITPVVSYLSEIKELLQEIALHTRKL